MIAAPVAFLGDFGDAIKLIFHERESVSGGVRIGGLGEFGDLALKHLEVSLTAVLLATALALPLGLILGHRGKGEFLAISTSNIGRAVPSLALLATFVAFVGLGFWNVTLVLILLAIPPILTNAYVGVRQADRDAVEAGRGMGLSEGQIIRRIELPLALPIIFGGVRTSAVNVVATATIAPLANVQTLGEPIVSPQIYGTTGQIAASLLVALLTLATDAGFAALQRRVTPVPLRPARSRFALSRLNPLTLSRRTA